MKKKGSITQLKKNATAYFAFFRLAVTIPPINRIRTTGMRRYRNMIP
jgi:hypothetical protein